MRRASLASALCSLLHLPIMMVPPALEVDEGIPSRRPGRNVDKQFETRGHVLNNVGGQGRPLPPTPSQKHVSGEERGVAVEESRERYNAVGEDSSDVEVAEGSDAQQVDPQLFQLSADLISGADAVAVAKMLNANIFQAAALIDDWLECGGWAIFLGVPVSSARPAFFQITLQAAIARWCTRKINAWCLRDEQFGEALCGLYEKILSAESQTTARRWRAITRSQTKRSDDDVILTSSLLDCLLSVVVAAEWHIDDPWIGKEIFGDEFAGQIAAIVKYSLQLRRATGEEIVSEDIEVMLVEKNSRFKAETMDDNFAVGGRVDSSGLQEGDLVACTTGIGLRRRRFGGIEAEDILLRPKVVLQSALSSSLFF
ncbi:hypothetical protein C8R46DRAFT_36830 [Mycena filopes]|nr:hypothetical protein C8R46DRAFT_36830 [Mycena filopes]